MKFRCTPRDIFIRTRLDVLWIKVLPDMFSSLPFFFLDMGNETLPRGKENDWYGIG